MTGTWAGLRRWSAVVWIGLVAFAAVVACSGDDEGSGRSTSTRPDRSQAPSDEPPDDGQVRVVDSGYTVFPGLAEPGTAFTPEAVAAGETFDVVSWGVVVENTSEWVAIHTDVSVRLVDATGAVVPTTGAEEWPGQETVVVLRPGERYGMGHTGGLERVVNRPPGNVPADLHVEIGRSQWLPPDTDRISPGELRATDLRTGQGSGIDPLAFRVDFTATSTYEALQQIWATAVFRDATGRIIGGTSRVNDSFGVDPDRVVHRGGRLPSSITIRHTVPNVDAEQSEVYLDPVAT